MKSKLYASRYYFRYAQDHETDDEGLEDRRANRAVFEDVEGHEAAITV